MYEKVYYIPTGNPAADYGTKTANMYLYGYIDNILRIDVLKLRFKRLVL